jgi:hypothetical protein
MPATVASRAIRPLRRRSSGGVEPAASVTPVQTSAAHLDLDALSAALAIPASSAIPPLDDDSAIDELAFLLATEHLSMLEKITLLEQWRYDMLLRDVASGEGLAEGRDSGALLQQLNKALLYLGDRRCRH